MATKMGFEGRIYTGAFGTTATGEIGNSRDINYNMDVDRGDTTVRGTGSTPPIKTGRVVAFGVSIEWTMLVKTGDTILETLRTAAAAGTPVAIRTKDYAAGKGFDGDCELSVKHGKPLGGEQTLVFTAEPTDETRAVSLYV